MATMTKKENRDKMLDRNYAAFEKALPDLVKTDSGRFAVIRDEKVVNCFDTARDAALSANLIYTDQNFSIQEIIANPVDLGVFSHVGFIRAA